MADTDLLPARLVLAIDVGSHRLSAGVVSEEGEVVVRDRVAAPPREPWLALQRLVRRVLAAAGDIDPLDRCGLTCEGPIDTAAGTVDPLQMRGLSGYDIRQRVADLTKLPTSLGSTGQGRMIAEQWVGQVAESAIDDRNAMVVYLSEAVEAGVIVDGRLLRGRLGNAGHLAHLVVEPGGAPCRCGGAGCLRAYVAASAIEEETNRPLRRTPTAVIERAGVMVGRSLASCVTLFDVQHVVLCGAIPSIFGLPMIEATRREFHQRSRPERAESTVTIEASTLGGEATLIGAAGVALLAGEANTSHPSP